VTPPDKIRYDCCVTVDDDFEPDDDMGVQTIAGGEYAVTTHHGPYHTLGNTDAKLCGQWMPRNSRRFLSAPCFEVYLNAPESTEAEATDRKAEILSERIEDPERAPEFELEDLEGNTWTLDDYEGQIVIVNFWGIWCGWCVIEMPDLQTLHESLVDDPEVTIITINNDGKPDEVPPWMEEKKYGFPVLLDDGYVAAEAGISAFPTTWVLDRSGRIVFNKVGWSQELIEEFTWRIESLRRQ